MTSISFPLLVENFGGGTGIQLNTGGGVGLNFPSNAVDFGEFCSSVTFVLSLAAVTGAPTSWKIGAKFQTLVPHTDNGMYQRRRWSDLRKATVASIIDEGCQFHGPNQIPVFDGGYGYIADQTTDLSTPLTITRTVRNFGRGIRLALDLPVTGGTTPRANLSINAIAHIDGGN